jgi:hypothetical protein
MAFPTIQPSFATGEIAPSLFGRVDLAKYHSALSTCRNFFVNFRGGAISRPGTRWINQSKTPGSSLYAPRLISWKFSLNQGYMLEFGNLYIRFIFQGAYVTETAKTITNITQGIPAVVTSAGHGFSTGDEVFIAGVSGMTQVNGRFFIVGSTGANFFTLQNLLDGSNTDSLPYSAYTSGGTAARVYTLDTPYAIADLAALKFTQSADVMSLTHNSYAPRDLTRVANNNWTLTVTTFAANISAPTASSASASSTTGSLSTSYGYVVTAISTSGEESIAGPIAGVTNSVDIGSVAGTITVTWSTVSGAKGYNIYRSPAAYNTSVPSGVIYGYAGSATSTAFIDTNIVPDFTFSPPLHLNPFSTSNDWPGDVAYFQQRRVYANTLAAPNTYFMSKPGAYTNFDAAFPTNDTDSITGTPWAQQVNGIQWMLAMPGGLVVFTGEGSWQVTGAGQGNNVITPATQSAAPQSYIGSNSLMQPIAINFDILYVQSKGSTVRDLVYNFFFQIYTSNDVTILASHLFEGHTLVAWGYAEEPYKLVWIVRDDGVMLTLTYLKEQDIYAWARHDTNGIYESVGIITEPPVDAVYVVVKRLVNGNRVYYIERFDNRLWTNVEETWAVDAGLALTQATPSATLMAASATGDNAIGTVVLIDGGSGYTTASVSADPGTGQTGSGAVLSASISGGAIINVAVIDGGSNWSAPITVRIDGDGTGASAYALISNPVNFSASSGVFSSSNVGDVIRMGGGVAEVLSVSSSTQIIADIIAPITATTPNDPNNTPLPQAAGNWTISTPVSTLSNLDHLEGMEVQVLADGSVAGPLTVTQGQIELAVSASSITVGLPFTCQLQTPYLDVPGANLAGRRKVASSMIVRVAQSRGIQIGTNQPDASVQPNGATLPWTNMVEIPMRGNGVHAGTPIPLFTGDFPKQSLTGTWAKGGQIAVQQVYPLPANVLATIADFAIGDTPG